MAFRDDRRRARRDLHETMQVPAYYLRTADAEPLLIHVRLHLTFGLVGSVQGARNYPAQMENDTPKIRFDLTELARPENNAIVSIEAGEAYRIDHMLPADDEFIFGEVVRLTATQATGLRYPDDGL